MHKWYFFHGKMDDWGLGFYVDFRPFAFVIHFVRWWVSVEYY